MVRVVGPIDNPLPQSQRPVAVGQSPARLPNATAAPTHTHKLRHGERAPVWLRHNDAQAAISGHRTDACSSPVVAACRISLHYSLRSASAYTGLAQSYRTRMLDWCSFSYSLICVGYKSWTNSLTPKPG